MRGHTYHWDSLGPDARIHLGPVDLCERCRDDS